ncbi:MAG: serine protein kinase RIO [Candidatus Micrarchaeota archaeon]
MARRLEKRKRPNRIDKPLSARSKIAGHVFDDKTLDVIFYLRNNKYITSLDYPISEGKEAIVFKGTSEEGDVAVKIFKYETSSFLRGSMMKYIHGDPRFPSVQLSHRSLVKLWSRKEFANLKICQDNEIAAPAPIKYRENVIVMQLIGEGGRPYHLLKDVNLENPLEIYEQIIREMKKMQKANLVHADLNEFNILTNGERMWFIDFAQAVKKEHPHAQEFLEKDCDNIAKYFSKRGVNTSKEEILEEIQS